jgi:hypothetical protein
MWWRLIPGPILRGVSWLLGAVVFAGMWFLIGDRNRAHKAANKALKQELKAHDRINQADTGVGATDHERIRRLHDLGNKWRD